MADVTSSCSHTIYPHGPCVAYWPGMIPLVGYEGATGASRRALTGLGSAGVPVTEYPVCDLYWEIAAWL